MFRPLAVNIGLRYARSRRSFISFVSVVALAGLVLSVAVLLFVQAIVNGFERELEQRILNVTPHATLFGRNPISDPQELLPTVLAVPGVLAAAPVIQGSGLISTGSEVAGIALNGIDPQSYPRVSALGSYVAEGSIDALRAGTYGVLLGRKLAERIRVQMGDDVTIVLPEASVTPLGVFPRQKRFEVVGIVHTASQLDQRSVYLHIADAAKLFRLGGAVHGIQLRVTDVLRAREVARGVRDAAGSRQYFATSWFRAHGNLYRAIRVQKGMLFLLLSLLVAVAAFNLVSTLVMVVNERRSDVAILRTMGAQTGLVMGTFLVLGVLIATVGVGLGIVVGFGLGFLAENGYAWLEQTFALDLMSEYFVHTLPVEFATADVVRVALTAVGLCVLSTVYPAWRATRLNPAEVLQYE
ncbi:MAG: lipoprotein-releasing ABC transporter permease subunit [Gammaproteobacteria bacterium]|nr:lipoprotein-releasing ABC transporter permease subunit [Gammaproteobacteria bacterium]